jgi:uncharacterized membrane protein
MTLRNFYAKPHSHFAIGMYHGTMKERVSAKRNYGPRTPHIVAAVALTAIVALIVALNATAPGMFSIYNAETISYEKAVVTAVLREETEPSADLPGRKLGSQAITVRFKNGTMRGRETEIVNVLSTTHNIYVRKGTNVIVKADRPEGIAPYHTLYGYDRTFGLALTALIFGAFMVAVGRFKGLRSFIGLILSLFFIFAFLLPAIYRGYPPVPAAILTVLSIAAVAILLLNGFGSKSYAALASVAAGVLLSAAFYALISTVMTLSGYNLEETEELILVSRSTGLKIGDVLFAGVLVSSLGAVIDTSVSVASTMYEIRGQRAEISAPELFRSGMNVGRDMIGSMSMTLIMAFAGGSIATLLSILAYGSRLDQILSSDYLAVEVAYGVTGSLAVIAAVPVTAGLCALLFGSSRRPAQKQRQQRGLSRS